MIAYFIHEHFCASFTKQSKASKFQITIFCAHINTPLRVRCGFKMCVGHFSGSFDSGFGPLDFCMLSSIVIRAMVSLVTSQHTLADCDLLNDDVSVRLNSFGTSLIVLPFFILKSRWYLIG